jgi:hypothetical protein
MLAVLRSFLLRPLRAISRRLPSRAPTLAWSFEGDVSVADWTAPEGAKSHPNAMVHSVRFAIKPTESLMSPYVLEVSPEGYSTVSIPASDLETAHTLALQQLELTSRLPGVAYPETPAEPVGPGVPPTPTPLKRAG